MLDILKDCFKDADLSNYPYHIGILGTDAQSATEDKQNEEYRKYRRHWNQYPQDFFVDDFPLCIDLEMAFTCNLRCVMCYVQNIPNYHNTGFKERLMPLDLAKKIIDEAAAHSLPSMKFTSRGESMLNRELEQIIGYAKKKNILDTLLNTNATLLSEERAKKLIGSGLDQLIVSLDGVSPHTYNNIRIGADYFKVLRNIENLINTRDRLGLKKPSLRVQIVCMDSTKNEVVAFIERWRTIANRINLIRYKDYSNSSYWMETNKKNRFKKIPCRQLWQRLFVAANGDIHICCSDYNGESVIGNALDNYTSIKSAWHSPRLEVIRSLHKRGEFFKIQPCSRCQSNIVGDFWNWLQGSAQITQNNG